MCRWIPCKFIYISTLHKFSEKYIIEEVQWTVISFYYSMKLLHLYSFISISKFQCQYLTNKSASIYSRKNAVENFLVQISSIHFEWTRETNIPECKLHCSFSYFLRSSGKVHIKNSFVTPFINEEMGTVSAFLFPLFPTIPRLLPGQSVKVNAFCWTIYFGVKDYAVLKLCFQ